MKLKEWLGTFIRPRPTLFDLAVVGILALPFIANDFYKGTYFVFFSIFLLCLSFSFTPRRSYRSFALCGLLLWSLFGVFARCPLSIVPNSIMNYYLNVSIMFEGFVYLLFGIMLFTTIIKYSTNIKYLIFLLPISAYPILKQLGHEGNITLVASLGLALLVYFIIHRKYWISTLIACVGIALTDFNWHWICIKWVSRPLMWRELMKEMYHHPLWGIGYNKTLSADNMITLRQGNTMYGLTFRHNDILSIGSYLGVVALIAVLLFCLDSIMKVRRTFYIIPLLTIFLMCNFKMTFFYPDRVAICLVIMGICVVQTYKEESCVNG